MQRIEETVLPEEDSDNDEPGGGDDGENESSDDDSDDDTVEALVLPVKVFSLFVSLCLMRSLGSLYRMSKDDIVEALLLPAKVVRLGERCFSSVIISSVIVGYPPVHVQQRILQRAPYACTSACVSFRSELCVS